MAKYARLNDADPPVVVGFYDTDVFHYDPLPSGLVSVSDDEWNARMNHRLWTIEDGRMVALDDPGHTPFSPKIAT